MLGVVGAAAATLFTPYLELRESHVLVSRFQMFLPWSELLPGQSLFPGWILLLLAIAGLVLAPRAGALDPRWALLAGWLRIPDDVEAQDDRDAQALLDILEHEVIPLFYKRDADGIPRAWVRQMKASIRAGALGFSARRMVRDYVDRAYRADT